ncbi:hypothetical protein ACF2JD_16795 [Aeromonas sp. A-5]|uniref:hypothetical protein n=1 Tax=Aeromonas ichthyocola TaxID=3367746 RepID=UPI0038DA6B1B
MNQSSHQIQLLRRPVGLPSLADFTLTEVALPELQEGEVRSPTSGCRWIPTCAVA